VAGATTSPRDNLPVQRRPFARKRFGQHFLERAWVDKLIAAIAPSGDQTFLEIGTGRGALTGPLAARAAHVLGFEIDRDLAAQLRASALPNLTVVDGDFLEIPVAQLVSLVQRELMSRGRAETLRVAGNLPYNVASPILFKLIELHAGGMPLTDATVMLQREVADRLTASPGTRAYGVLTVLIGQSATIERLLSLPPGAFRPVPKVHSAVVRLRFHAPEPLAKNPQRFAALVQAIFTQRRKTLSNALKAFPLSGTLPVARVLETVGLDGGRRPEALTISELVRLADAFATIQPDEAGG
jgi:16S rRNA (adenine1518-N6/adenine1519-N6)-dimethyltransferase